MRERSTSDGCRCGRDISTWGRAERHEDLRDGAAPSNPERQSLPPRLRPIRQQYLFRSKSSLLRKLLKKQGVTRRVMTTDKLASYAIAKKVVMPRVEHRQHKGLNNRAENSHQPTRRREHIMKRFKSAGQAQRFLSVHDQGANFLRRPANTNAADHRKSRTQAFMTWAEVTGIAAGF